MPVVFDTSVSPVFARPKFTVAAVGALLVLALAGAEAALRRAAPHWRNGLEVPVLLLVAWTAIAAAASPDASTSVWGARESINGLATAVVLAVLFLAVAEAVDRSEVTTALSLLWFGGGGIVLLYGAVQLGDRLVTGGRWDPVAWRNVPGERVIWSTLGNPNDLAGFLAVILPVGLVLLLRGRHPGVRAVTASMVVLLLVELAVTTSRGALLAAVAGVVVLGVWLRREIGERAGLVLAAAGGSLGVAVAATALLLATDHIERGPGDLLATGERTTPALRVELWRTAWRMAGEHPVVGVGPDNFGGSFDEFRSERFVRVYGPDPVATDPHNVFLSYLATQGFPGLVAFLFLVGSALALVLKAGPPLVGTEDRAILGALGAGLLAYLVQASFNRQDIALDFCAWFLLGLACVVAGGLRSPAGGAGAP